MPVLYHCIKAKGTKASVSFTEIHSIRLERRGIQAIGGGKAWEMSRFADEKL